MFATAPVSDWLPNWRTPPNKSFWLLAVLSDFNPWYVVTFLTRDSSGEEEDCRTVLVSWESQLVKLVDSIREHDVLSLQRAQVVNENGFWSLDEVTEVYVPDANAEEDTMRLLLKVQGDERLFASRGGVIELKGAIRRLYARRRPPEPQPVAAGVVPSAERTNDAAPKEFL